MKGKVHGTTFLAKVESTTVLFGAGHLLLTDSWNNAIVTSELKKGINLDDYKVNFGDLDGQIKADGITIEQLRRTFSTTLVVQCNALQHSFKFQNGSLVPSKPFLRDPQGINMVIDNAQEKQDGFMRDYFYLILHERSSEPDADEELQQKVEEMVTLPVGDEAFLDPANGEPVLIIGHPGAGGADWGNERIVEKNQSWGIHDSVVKERILYDLKTRGGHSGSPVLGRGGKVKGIHVEGGGPGKPGTRDGVNKAQIMSRIIPDVKEKIKEYNKNK